MLIPNVPLTKYHWRKGGVYCNIMTEKDSMLMGKKSFSSDVSYPDYVILSICCLKNYLYLILIIVYYKRSPFLENVIYVTSEQARLKSACASAQSD